MLLKLCQAFMKVCSTYFIYESIAYKWISFFWQNSKVCRNYSFLFLDNSSKDNIIWYFCKCLCQISMKTYFFGNENARRNYVKWRDKYFSFPFACYFHLLFAVSNKLISWNITYRFRCCLKLEHVCLLNGRCIDSMLSMNFHFPHA